jgi:tripartite-type tricarboxylate transporter receptor subunit TctC
MASVHGWGVGGNADLIARITAERLAARLGQSVVVEPKPGDHRSDSVLGPS